ncbi:unnamed protein product, partial [Oppiella nova]
MSEISGKRRRSECQTNGTNVFFIRDGIHRKRMTILERNAQTLGLVVSDHFRESIDYIISDFEYEEQVMESIGCDIRELKAVVVNTRWLTDSMQSQQLMPFNTDYRLKRRHKGIDSKSSNECSKESSNGDYICQRMSSLNHQNSKLSEPLEVMAKEAKLRAHLFDTVRYLGFKKAAAVLKSLPFAVKHVDEVSYTLAWFLTCQMNGRSPEVCLFDVKILQTSSKTTNIIIGHHFDDDLVNLRHELQYSVIIDAGSSGSRVHIYVWPPHSGDTRQLLQIRML